MYKIFYDKKTTNANTDYVTISQQDQDILTTNIISILCYFGELSVNKAREIKDFMKWFNTPSEQFNYNRKSRRYNSPNSYLSGILNNLMFGTQKNFSVNQLETLQLLINFAIEAIEAIENDFDIKLQKSPLLTKIFVQENVLTFGN